MTYIYDGKIDTKNFNELAEFSNSMSDPFTLYFSSPGGWVDMIPVYLDFFRNEGHRISLKGFSTIYSAGFEIFFLAEVAEKALLDSCIGMYHGSSISLSLTEDGKLATDYDRARMENMKTVTKKSTSNLLKLLPFLEKDRKAILGGESIYFNTSKMKKLLK